MLRQSRALRPPPITRPPTRDVHDPYRSQESYGTHADVELWGAHLKFEAAPGRLDYCTDRGRRVLSKGPNP